MEIILPKTGSNPEKIRLMAKKKGKLVKKVIVDGKEIIKEKGFVI